MIRLVIDIEADGLGEVTLTNKGPTKEVSTIWCAVAMNADTQEVKTFTQSNMHTLVDYLNTADLIIGHNILSFDIPVIRRLLGNLKRPKHGFFDTLVVSRIMYPDRNNHPLGGNSLECWGKYLGNHKIDYTGGWSEFSDEMLEYCIQDVKLGCDIFRHQSKFAKENLKVFQFEHMVSEILAQQTERGFGYDIVNGEKLYVSLLQEKAELEDRMRAIFPDKIHYRKSEKTGKDLKPKIETFNPGSRKQIAERLSEKYGWVPPETEKGNPKVDESVLAALDYPEAKELVKYFDLVKLMGMVEDWNSRASSSRDSNIHGYVNAQGAATGRCTHSEPNIAQVSGDHRARELWIPYEGYVQLGSDLSGLELRMLAHFMHKYDNGKYADVLLNGDIHTYNQKAAGIESRALAKSFIYAYLYGAGDKKISLVLNCSVNQAARLRDKFQKEIPALAKVQEEVRYHALKHNAVILPDGRKVPVRSEHAALNTLLQGSGAIVSKYWMVLANHKLNKLYPGKAHQMAYVHDELQYAVCPTEADNIGKLVTSCATDAGERLAINIPIAAEYKIGKNWSETH